MKAIPVSHKKMALVDDEDYDRVRQHKWYLIVNKHTTYARADIEIDGKRTAVFMHRFVLGLTKGDPLVDHWNRNGLDNQRKNLRTATNGQNMANSIKMRSKRGCCPSTYKGVTCADCLEFSGWEANIRHDGGTEFLGHFGDAKEAALVYDAAARRLHGEFARVNFPGPGERPAILSQKPSFCP